ncbi:hypothetical protein Tco_1014912 [Tanacetum coccineum]
MSASTSTSNTGYLFKIEPLTGTNFSKWRDQVKLTLGVMDVDHALLIDPPAALTATSTTDQKRMDIEINEGFLVHFLMTSLPIQFGPFKINYNTQKENERLIAMCVQEEERLKIEKPDVVHVATTNSNKRKGSWKGKGSSGDNSTPNKGFHTIRRLERNQQTVKVGNGVDLNVEAVRTLSLILEGDFCLNLYGTLYFRA